MSRKRVAKGKGRVRAQAADPGQQSPYGPQASAKEIQRNADSTNVLSGFDKVYEVEHRPDGTVVEKLDRLTELTRPERDAELDKANRHLARVSESAYPENVQRPRWGADDGVEVHTGADLAKRARQLAGYDDADLGSGVDMMHHRREKITRDHIDPLANSLMDVLGADGAEQLLDQLERGQGYPPSPSERVWDSGKQYINPLTGRVNPPRVEVNGVEQPPDWGDPRPYLGHPASPQTFTAAEALNEALTKYTDNNGRRTEGSDAEVRRLAGAGQWLFGHVPNAPDHDPDELMLCTQWNRRAAEAVGWRILTEPELINRISRWQSLGMERVKIQIIVGASRSGQRWTDALSAGRGYPGIPGLRFQDEHGSPIGPPALSAIQVTV